MLPWDAENVDSLMATTAVEVRGACGNCGGKGWAITGEVDSVGIAEVRRCSCHRRLKRYLDFIEAGIPSAFWNASGIIKRAKTEDARLVRRYSRKLQLARDTGFGLLLVGPNGCGKTTAAIAVLARARFLGMSIAYSSVDDMLKASNTFDDRSAIAWLDARLSCDFLVMDELGKETSAREGRATILIEQYLRHRWSSKSPTIICSNIIDSGDYQSKYGASVVSVLTGRSRMIHMKAQSYRLRERARLDREIFG